MTELNDILNSCRVCMAQYKSMNNIFDSVKGGKISDKITFCTGLHITSTDTLPTQICDKCLQDLSVAHKFKTACLFADGTFRKVVKVEIKIEELDVSDEDFFKGNCDYINGNGNEGKKTDDKLIEHLMGNGIVVKKSTQISKVDEELIGTKVVPYVPIVFSNNQQIENDICTRKKIHNKLKGEENKVNITKSVQVMVKPKEKLWVKKNVNRSTESKSQQPAKKHPLMGMKIQNKCMFTPLTCEWCQIKFNSKQECDDHKKADHKESFICEICGVTINKRSSYYVHMNTHKPLKHKCDVCGYQTSQKSVLAIHLQRHTGVRAYKCHLCPKDYYYMTTLRDHIRRDHERIKPHACHLCDKRYFEKIRLLSHIDSHNNIKRYECEICFSRFSRRSHWKRHLLNQHDKTVPRAKPGKKDKYLTVVDALVNNSTNQMLLGQETRN